mmetsp:Transcript_28949/g.72762  ORF Transcript_28949/g.72762 Transcript_28949/m.72762 type:complete len:83 (-) Transcript_28949:57-305(-)
MSTFTPLPLDAILRARGAATLREARELREAPSENQNRELVQTVVRQYERDLPDALDALSPDGELSSRLTSARSEPNEKLDFL